MMNKLLGLLLIVLLSWPAVGEAARQTNGTNQSLQTASAIDFGGATLVSISVWLYWDAYANDNDLALETNTFATGNPAEVQLNPNSSAPSGVFLVNVNADVGNNSVTFTRPSAAAWHHYLINIDIGHATQEVRSVYVDGSSVTLTGNQTNNNTQGFGSEVWYLMSRENTSLFGAGRIADLAFWSGINLSGTDATNLNGGTAPTSVESGSLVFYWKMCGDASPEPYTTGGINLTVNSATQVAHPSAIASFCSVRQTFIPGVY